MHIVGLFVDLSYSHYRDVQRGVQQYALTQTEWDCVLLPPDLMAVSVLAEMGGCGAIGLINGSVAADLHKRRIATVSVSGRDPHLPVPRVANDDVAIGQMAAEHLMAAGLEQFAYWGFGADVHFSHQREVGFRGALERRGFRVYAPSGDFSFQRETTGIEWIRSLPKPIGIFGASDSRAYRLMRLCRRADLRVPNEVAVLGVDNDEPYCTSIIPSMSSVSLASERIGWEAASMLDRILRGESLPSFDRQIAPIRVVARQSTDLTAVDDPELAAVLRWMRERADQPVALKEVLREFSMSESTLRRKFRAIGRTPSQEIRDLHVQAARELLARTSLPISQVALRSGFPNAYRLSTVFQRLTGETPRSYRRRFRNFV